METKIATNENQSKKFIELGLSADTADMHYNKWDNDEEEEYYLKCGGLPKLEFKYATNIPAWSLSALIELMPMYLLNDDDEEFGLEIVTTYKNEYKVCYQELLPPIYNSSLIDAVFEMVCYLLENKLIK